LGGRPLIVYTFKAAQKSRLLDRILLSTDDEEIAELGRKYSIEVPFLRPVELAGDNTPALPVIQHAVRYLEETEGYRPDHIVILQPTSPLRQARHIDEALELLVSSGADSVVSVMEVPHQFNPLSVMRIVEGRLEPYIPQDKLILRRQDKPKVYARNGAAVYAIRYETVMIQNSLFGDDCRPYMMGPQESVDIDAISDLQYAAYLLQKSENEV
jgi:CMP-N-acetylneuraminic acid synthetase